MYIIHVRYIIYIICVCIIIGAISGCTTKVNAMAGKVYTEKGGKQVIDRMGVLENFTDLEFKNYSDRIELFGKIDGKTKLISKTVYDIVGAEKVYTPRTISQSQLEYYKELVAINGVGEKNAELIMKYYPTKESLIAACKIGGELPFHKDIDKLLIQKYGR